MISLSIDEPIDQAERCLRTNYPIGASCLASPCRLRTEWLDDVLVAGAAAKIAFELVADLFFGRIRIALKQRDARS